ncbi:hypothetical protein [Curtobacterium sp. ISL-83]|uniref:hypothetical protein n=1 Tax=Curtobacterium sp. ISL-83 TaxID=2819145 RepID=UPI001BE6641E|nr:hypothetical protein [Curtobacterium sp. ISL-83]MBT2501071.1 hypothetical protein [Curtobacterium sp. ISL-83]
MTGEQNPGRRRARPLTRRERTAKRRASEQPMWLPQPWRFIWSWLVRPIVVLVLKILNAAASVWP